MRKKILIAVGVVLAVLIAFLLYIAAEPSHYVVSRSETIHATPAITFARVNDFHNWEDWSPWAKLDPQNKVTYSGSAAGEGAVFTWSGNDKVGEGKMTLIESRLNERIGIKLDFVRPFVDTANVEFIFKPQGNQTVVTWSMSGENTFVGRIFCFFMNMDKMLGGDLEKGLAQMNQVASTQATTEPGR